MGTGAMALYVTFGLGGSPIEEMMEDYKVRVEQITERVVLNNDGTLRLEDVADMVFDLIDTDQSGVIDREELRNHFDRVTVLESSTDSQTKEYMDTIFSVIH